MTKKKTKKTENKLQNYESNLACLNNDIAATKGTIATMTATAAAVPLATLGIPGVMINMLITSDSLYATTAKLTITAIAGIVALYQKYHLDKDLSIQLYALSIFEDMQKDLRTKGEAYTLSATYQDDVAKLARQKFEQEGATKSKISTSFDMAVFGIVAVSIIANILGYNQTNDKVPNNPPCIISPPPPYRGEENKKLPWTSHNA